MIYCKMGKKQMRFLIRFLINPLIREQFCKPALQNSLYMTDYCSSRVAAVLDDTRANLAKAFS